MNYEKNQDNKLKIIILGVKNLLSNEINFKNISIKEKKNKFEIQNLLLSKQHREKVEVEQQVIDELEEEAEKFQV